MAVGRVRAMAHRTAPGLLVLHALRLKGFAEADVVARASGLDEATVASACASLADESLVQRRDGRLSGWSLTSGGRAAHAERIVADLDVAGQRGVVDGAYRRFLGVNGEMLAICTAWQLREVDGRQAVNDHGDPAWDAAVLDRLRAVDRALAPVLVELSAALERYGPYASRLAEALAKVEAGELEWFTRPVIDSYHTVWFELHEDLLSSLGIDRASEAQHAT